MSWDLDWQHDWIRAARANLDLLRDGHELAASAPMHFGLVAAADDNIARALRHLLQLEVDANSMFAALATRRVAKDLHRFLPYSFLEGQAILSVEQSIERGYWACGDTSAAAAAAFALHSLGGHKGWSLSLCTETVVSVPGYAHCRLVVSRSVVEPWSEARRPEANGCTLLDDVLQVLIAPT